MKFGDVKIRQMFLYQISEHPMIKIGDSFAVYKDVKGEWQTISLGSRYEVELVSKCANCKHYDGKLGKDDCVLNIVTDGYEYYLERDPKTFSCSEGDFKL